MVECPFCYYYINAMKIPVSFMLRMFGDKIRGRSTRARSEICLFKDPVIPVGNKVGPTPRSLQCTNARYIQLLPRRLNDLDCQAVEYIELANQGSYKEHKGSSTTNILYAGHCPPTVPHTVPQRVARLLDP